MLPHEILLPIVGSIHLPTDLHNLVTLAKFQCCHQQAVDALFIGSTVTWESQAGITTSNATGGAGHSRPSPALPVLPHSSPVHKPRCHHATSCTMQTSIPVDVTGLLNCLHAAMRVAQEF